MITLKFELSPDALRLLVASDMYIFLVAAFIYHRPDPKFSYASVELSVPVDKLSLVQEQLLFLTTEPEITKEEIRMELGDDKCT